LRNNLSKKQLRSTLSHRQSKTRDDLEAVYVGPLLDSGEMDLLLLSDATSGIGSLVKRVDQLLYKQTYEHSVRLASPFRTGSFILPLDFIAHTVESGKALLSTPGMIALGTLMSILGWGAVPAAKSLFRIFKKRAGRPITEEDDLLEFAKLNIDVEVQVFIKIYNDQDVQTALRRTLRPLRENGIDEFQTKKKWKNHRNRHQGRPSCS
jgi:hypothetical protein